MNATVMAIILVLIVVATVVTKKVPFNFVLFIVPIICSLLLGFSLQETSDFVLEQFSSIMKSAAFMLLFAFLYFQMRIQGQTQKRRFHYLCHLYLQ